MASTFQFSQQQWLVSFFQHLSNPAFILLDDSAHQLQLVSANPAFLQLLPEPVSLPASLADIRLPSDWADDLKKQLSELAEGCSCTLQLKIRQHELERCFVLSLQLSIIEQQRLYFALLTDITQWQQQCRQLQQKLSDIERLKNRIREQAIRDPLTNLFNRRFLNEFMERELALARRNQKPLSLVMLDLDHFKQLNDQFGHQTGDQIIELVARHLLRQSRRSDILFRYGGEEFLILLPNTTEVQAGHLAESWRAQIEQSQIFAAEQPLTVTISAGVACYPEHGTTAFNLIQAADQALYQAKAAGRNRVITL
ncbi:GGDEF domain-containing protein [Rheinheimera sp.]|uniref:GGDEF domain-containing protein n=1 Tax=Rheinheimera sp. TaxID=1869214 RepID=UPI00307EF32E